jgi:RsiW-degrading membrane proteinase PrsW (M82 family)
MLLIVALSFAPGIFWMYYFYKRDEIEPEPLHLIRNCFFLGMAVVVPAAVIESVLSYSPWVNAVVAAPIVEEGLKFLAVRYTVYQHKEFDEPMDGVVYAAAVALGFASLENMAYLYSEYYKAEGSFASVSLIRAFFSVPGHALWSSVWGGALGFAKFSHSKNATAIVAPALLLGMLLHSLFNFFVMTGPLWLVSLGILAPLTWELVQGRIRMALKASPHMADNDYEPPPLLAESSDEPPTDVPWYQNRLVIVGMLFFLCFPIGIYGLWTTPLFSKPVKISYSVLWFYLAGFLGIYAGVG